MERVLPSSDLHHVWASEAVNVPDYLQSHAGIQGEFEQSVAYIQGWLKVLKEDRKCIFSASTAAQKAVDYILDIQAGSDEKEE